LSTPPKDYPSRHLRQSIYPYIHCSVQLFLNNAIKDQHDDLVIICPLRETKNVLVHWVINKVGLPIYSMVSYRD